MSQFIFKIEKKEEENNIPIEIYTFDKNKLNHLIKTKEKYIIYLKSEDLNKINIKTKDIKIIKDKYKNFNEELLSKLIINKKELYKYLIEKFKELNIELYELDLKPEFRYLIDNKLPIYVKNDKNLLKNTIKEKENNLILPKIISLDIETIQKNNKIEIISISLYSKEENLKTVILNTNNLKDKNIKTNKNEFEILLKENEKDLLIELKNIIKNINPTIIIGWNVIDFDFKIIKEKFKEYNLKFNLNDNFEGECNLKIYSDFFKESTLDCPGLVVLDLIHLLKSNYIKFEDYKLNTVAKSVLSEEKLDLNYDTKNNENEEYEENKIEKIKELYLNNPKKLCEYNLKDSILTYKICEKLHLIKLLIQRSYITDTPLTKIKSPIATLDIMYLKEAHDLGYIAPTNTNYNKVNPITGAYVIEPKKGFYEDVFVLDFKSLYPSIIMTFNIDPLTYNKSNDIIAPNGAKYSNKKGILPKIILKLYNERNKAKKEKDKIKSHALKITMNSFYGALASPKSRFFNQEIAGSITAFGREIIKMTVKFIEKKGYKAIYGDTDSCFVQIPNINNLNPNEKIKIGKKLEKELNEYFDNWIKNNFKTDNYLKIEFEKLFSKFFISTKKRYVGYDEIEKKIIFTGLEAVRGDWTELAKEFQKELVNIIFKEDKNEIKSKIKNLILNTIDKLKKGELDNKLVYKKKITKPLSEYTKTTPPHVKAARELPEFKGNIVEYIITTEGPKHINIFKKKKYQIDYNHYIEKQLKAVADDFLESLNINFDKIVLSKKQTSLNKFF